MMDVLLIAVVRIVLLIAVVKSVLLISVVRVSIIHLLRPVIRVVRISIIAVTRTPFTIAVTRTPFQIGKLKKRPSKRKGGEGVYDENADFL
jgi:hypothetical protein